MTKPEKVPCTDPKEIHAQNLKLGLAKHTCQGDTHITMPHGTSLSVVSLAGHHPPAATPPGLLGGRARGPSGGGRPAASERGHLQG